MNHIADAIAREVIEEEYTRRASSNPERFASVSMEDKRKYEDGIIEGWRSYARDMLAKSPELVRRVASGQLHPSNRRSRRLFTAVTGIDLPQTVAGTMKVASDYLGDLLTQFYADRDAKIMAAKKAERTKSEAKHRALIEGLSAKCRADDCLSPDDVLKLAKHLSIEVHPRTAGAMRRHVVTMNSHQARVYKRATRCPQSIYVVYSQCRDKLLSQGAT